MEIRISKSNKYYGNKATKTIHCEAQNDACLKGAVKKKNLLEIEDTQEIDKLIADEGYSVCHHGCFKIVVK